MTLLERAILRTLGHSPKTTTEILAALRLSPKTSRKVVLLVCARLRADRRINRVQTSKQGIHVWFLLDANRVSNSAAESG